MLCSIYCISRMVSWFFVILMCRKILLLLWGKHWEICCSLRGAKVSSSCCSYETRMMVRFELWTVQCGPVFLCKNSPHYTCLHIYMFTHQKELWRFNEQFSHLVQQIVRHAPTATKFSTIHVCSFWTIKAIYWTVSAERATHTRMARHFLWIEVPTFENCNFFFFFFLKSSKQIRIFPKKSKQIRRAPYSLPSLINTIVDMVYF